METGSYTFHFGVDPGVESGEDLGGTLKGELYLEYEPFYAASESEAVDSSRGGSVRSQPQQRKERKNAEQINDFLRKIGFVDSEKEGGDFIKQFLHLSQVVDVFFPLLFFSDECEEAIIFYKECWGTAKYSCNILVGVGASFP